MLKFLKCMMTLVEFDRKKLPRRGAGLMIPWAKVSLNLRDLLFTLIYFFRIKSVSFLKS